VPPVIFGIGLNYRAYAKQIGKDIPRWPLVFVKQGFAVISSGERIVLPKALPTEKVDYEGELAVVIGKEAKNVTEAEAFDFIEGYTVANDVSARDWQFEKGGGQFTRGKTFDTFCPIGPFLLSPEEVPDPHSLTLETRVNGELRQISSTGDMIFSIPQLIAFLSADTTLLPGTVILTGTPGGTGSGQEPPSFLKSGDVVLVNEVE